MRILGAVALAAVLAGCTSVKMVQREGCWIRRTEKMFGRVTEEVGPCMRPQPAWVEDRLTRLVQECVAQADYRWQVRATEAWMRRQPYPAQLPQEEILRTCMEDSRTGLIAENERLKKQLDDLSVDRDTLRAGSEQDRAQLRASHDRIADYLGEAAKKPAGAAYATAASSSDGKATNESGATLASEARALPGTSAAGAPAAMPPGPPAVPAAPPALEPVRAPEPSASPPRRTNEARARRPKAAVPAAKAGVCGSAPTCAPPAAPPEAAAADPMRR